MNVHSESIVTSDNDEFDGFSNSESSDIANGNKPTINDQPAALLEAIDNFSKSVSIILLGIGKYMFLCLKNWTEMLEILSMHGLRNLKFDSAIVSR
jgi:hypothetical protein